MYLGLLNGLFLLRFMARAGGSHLLYWLVLLGLFLFSAFRFRVGCDWIGYHQNFAIGSTISFADAFSNPEPLWWAIQVAFNQAGLSYPWINVFTSAVFFFGMHELARRQPDRLGFLVLLFPILIINMPMSGIRQGAAIGLICIALIALKDERPFRFVAWTVLAAGIHASAMAFLLLTPLATGLSTKVRLALAAMLSIPALIGLSRRDEIELAVERYVNTDIEAFGAVYRVGILALTGMYFLLVLRRRWSVSFPGDFGVANLGAFMMIALTLLLPFSSVIADRTGYYLIPIQAMMFARIPYLGLGRSQKLQTALPYIGLLLVFTYWSFSSYLFTLCYVPYQTWLFGYPERVHLLPFE
jgi:hypothetical protein